MDIYKQCEKAGVMPGNLEKCQCAYCRDGGMSKSGAECVERMAEVTKRLKASLARIYLQRRPNDQDGNEEN